MTIESRCHCGATKLVIKANPDSLTECNCTFCSKHGVLWAYYDPEEVVLESVGNTVVRGEEGSPQHHFCSICHCLSYYYQAHAWTDDGSPGKPFVGVNARLFESIDLASLPLKKVDGLNGW